MRACSDSASKSARACSCSSAEVGAHLLEVGGVLRADALELVLEPQASRLGLALEVDLRLLLLLDEPGTARFELAVEVGAGLLELVHERGAALGDLGVDGGARLGGLALEVEPSPARSRRRGRCGPARSPSRAPRGRGRARSRPRRGSARSPGRGLRRPRGPRWPRCSQRRGSPMPCARPRRPTRPTRAWRSSASSATSVATAPRMAAASRAASWRSCSLASWARETMSSASSRAFSRIRLAWARASVSVRSASSCASERRRCDLVLCGAAQLLGVDVGLRDEAGRLLLGDAERVLELRAEAGEGRAADLFELGGQLFDARVETLDLLGLLGELVVRLDDVASEPIDALVDLILVVSAEHLRELGLFDGHSSSGLGPAFVGAHAGCVDCTGTRHPSCTTAHRRLASRWHSAFRRRLGDSQTRAGSVECLCSKPPDAAPEVCSCASPSPSWHSLLRP